MSVLAYFRGGPWDRHSMELPDGRDRWAMPHIPERPGAFFFGTSCGPLPQPALYERSHAHELEMVVTEDVVVRAGMLLSGFEVKWAWALVYDCISEGGR